MVNFTWTVGETNKSVSLCTPVHVFLHPERLTELGGVVERDAWSPQSGLLVEGSRDQSLEMAVHGNRLITLDANAEDEAGTMLGIRNFAGHDPSLHTRLIREQGDEAFPSRYHVLADDEHVILEPVHSVRLFLSLSALLPISVLIHRLSSLILLARQT